FVAVPRDPGLFVGRHRPPVDTDGGALAVGPRGRGALVLLAAHGRDGQRGGKRDEEANSHGGLLGAQNNATNVHDNCWGGGGVVSEIGGRSRKHFSTPG